MTGAVAQRTSGTEYQRQGSGLVDVVDLILEKGLVIDIYARVALVGIEILTVDVRIVVASVDTYLRFAEAVNRLDLTQTGTAKGLPEMVGDMQQTGAGNKAKGALQGAGEAIKDTFTSSESEKRPARRRSTKKEDDA
ncbi:gas vesicle protein GvpJ [Spirillospora sp. CA-294931]|uniref:gas vesicle protein GvpJ n=1 Tax=Spirillospora sp. CA-294931 TaxID=3240042 RepID=UPI003D8C3365